MEFKFTYSRGKDSKIRKNKAFLYNFLITYIFPHSSTFRIRGDIVIAQTCHISQIEVFGYREMGGQIVYETE
jgi:hypothetical protein